MLTSTPALLLQLTAIAMARRRGAQTRFVSLLEPYAEEPRVTGFRALGPQSFEVTARDFVDTFSLDDAGTLAYQRIAR